MTQAPAPRRRGRPPKAKPEIEDDLIGTGKASAKSVITAPYRGEGEPLKPDMQLAHVYGGVTADWLAHIFGADRRTIQKKLAKATDAQLGNDSRGSMKYSLPHAVAYLVRPKVDIAAWIRGLRPQDLPPVLNDAYWAAMLKRQKWEENARELWRTEDVLSVFSDTAFMYKTTTQLWVEELDRHHTLTPEMRNTINQLVDNLLEQVHENLVEMPTKRSTFSTSMEESTVSDDDAGDSA